MTRVINPNSTGKSRNQHMRTLAEMLRRMAAKGDIDIEVKDMVAAMVYILRDIDAGVDSSAQAWEKRDYWLKADRFRREWEWAPQSALEAEKMIREDAWDRLSQFVMDLYPHVSSVRIKKLTRKPELWEGAYDQLVAEATQE